jgi:hypothetical protein
MARRGRTRRCETALLIASAMALLASAAWADTTIVPDPTITPGAVRTTDVALILKTAIGMFAFG